MVLPKNNAGVLARPDDSKDRFFVLADVSYRDATHGTYYPDGEFEIKIDPIGPIVALREEDQATIEQESGVRVPLRKHWDKPEERAQYGLPENLRMIGAGGIVSVQVGNETPLTVLFEKTAGPSEGKLAQASGLSDHNPLQIMWAEIVEETGLLIVNENEKRLDLVVLLPAQDDLDPAFSNLAEQGAFFDALENTKKGQIETIRSQLPEDVKDWDITPVRMSVVPSPEDDALLESVVVLLPYWDELDIDNFGKMAPRPVRVIVSDSEKTANLNLLKPVRLNLPEGTRFICVDPEEFKRTMHLVTRAEMLTRDFIDNRASVPMKPYLEKAMALKNNLVPTTAPAAAPTFDL